MNARALARTNSLTVSLRVPENRANPDANGQIEKATALQAPPIARGSMGNARDRMVSARGETALVPGWKEIVSARRQNAGDRKGAAAKGE